MHRRNKLSGLARREAMAGYMFISPWILGFLIFTLGPMIASLVLSFTDWDLLTHPSYSGLYNYSEMFKNDPRYIQSLKVTFIYSLTSVPLHLISSLLVAILLNQKIKGSALFRTILYLPSMVSGVANALLWRWMYSPEWGLINWLLGLMGIQGPPWLYSKDWALPALIFMSIWGLGQTMVIFLAGLKDIPLQLYEAAEIDGANTIQRFRYITLPMLSPVIFFNLIMGIIGSFQAFTTAQVMTGGGPSNATLLYVLYLYENAFLFFKMGYASAQAWVLFLIVVSFSLLVIKSSPMWVYYEGEMKRRK